MSEENKKQDGLPEQDAFMVYFAPELMQSMADLAAKKQESHQELLAAAEAGDPEAQYQLGLQDYSGTGGAGSDEKQAFYWLEQAAQADHLAARYSLAICYARGIGTEQDMELAAELFQETADQGYIPALCDLGLCYELGNGVEMDKERAMELYQEAAEQEYAPAQCNLGFFYYVGIATERNYPEAVRWFTLAAEQGFPRAQFLLGE